MALCCSQLTKEALRLQQLVHAHLPYVLLAQMPCLHRTGCELAKDSPKVILHCSAPCCEQHAGDYIQGLGSGASGRLWRLHADEMQCKKRLDAYLPDGELQHPSAEFLGPSLGCEAELWDCSCSGSRAGQMERGNSLPPRWRTLAGRPCSAARSEESS